MDMLPSLYLGKNTIPGCSVGVFARKTIKKGTVLGPFPGEVVGAETIRRRYWGTYPKYVLAIHRGTKFIDGGVYTSMLREINAANKTGRLKNVTFTDRGNIVVIRDIKPGVELLVSYGRHYDGWKHCAIGGHPR